MAKNQMKNNAINICYFHYDITIIELYYQGPVSLLDPDRLNIKVNKREAQRIVMVTIRSMMKMSTNHLLADPILGRVLQK